MKHERGAKNAAYRPPSGATAWLFPAVALLLFVFIIGDTIWRHAALSAVTSVRTAEAVVDPGAVSAQAVIRSTIPPLGSMDARWWIIYTEQQLEEGRLRIRRNLQDNHPAGREVHWSSLPMWVLASLSIATSLFAGRPAPQCVQDAALLFGPVTLTASLLLLGWMAWRLFTPAVTGFFLLAFSLSPSVYQAFRPGEVDHHGIVLTFLLAGFLAILVAGKENPDGTRRRGPKSSEAAATRWAAAAGFFHGAALWISASSTIPLLVGCGLGAVVSAVFMRRCLMPPALWQTWGVAGCVASCVFYLLEYFPSHMGWRLEINHPLWSFAWLGGSILLGLALVPLGGGKIATPRWISAKALLAAVLLIAPVALTLLLPSHTFLVSDPFLLELHRHFISEFQSLPAFFAENALFPGCLEVGLLPIFSLGLAGIMLRYRASVPDLAKTSALFLAGPVLVIQLLAFWQIRWGITSVGLWSLFAAVMLSGVFCLRGGPRILVFALVALTTALLITLPVGIWVGLANRASSVDQMPKSVVPSILARDLAHRLVQASGQEIPVVLTGPTTSTDLAYFGGVKVLGTLYWENRDGLVHAARIFSEPSPEEIKRLLQEAGVSFVLIPSWEDFVMPYTELLGRGEHGSESFIGRLTSGEDLPDWLRPLHYPNADGFEVRLFRFMTTQTPAQAALHLGIYHAERQAWNEAHDAFNKAAKLDPLDPTITSWLRQAEQSLKNQPPSNP
jgi:hypothetical protein